jgi:hypothetical protein
MSARTERPADRSARSGTLHDQTSGKRSLPPARRSAPLHRDTAELARAARRFIRSIGNRLAGEDDDGLALLQGLDDELADAWATAIAGLRRAGYSDVELGQRLGITRQAIQQRWPRTDDDPTENPT